MYVAYAHSLELMLIGNIQLLKQRKRDKVNAVDVKDRPQRDYMLKIIMPHIFTDDGKIKIWRSVKVPGTLTMDRLYEHVIVPAFNWVSGYHGYIFTDRRDGALFGP